MNKLFQKIKRWIAGEPVEAKLARIYSIQGWERGADMVYRNGKDTICLCGRKWTRDNGTEYPTLRAAIKGEWTPVEPGQRLFPAAGCKAGEHDGRVHVIGERDADGVGYCPCGDASAGPEGFNEPDVLRRLEY